MDDKFRDYAKVIARDIARVYAGARFRLVKGMKGFVFFTMQTEKSEQCSNVQRICKKTV